MKLGKEKRVDTHKKRVKRDKKNFNAFRKEQEQEKKYWEKAPERELKAEREASKKKEDEQQRARRKGFLRFKMRRVKNLLLGRGWVGR